MAKKADGTKKGNSKERMTGSGVMRPVNLADIKWANKPTAQKGKKK